MWHLSVEATSQRPLGKSQTARSTGRECGACRAPKRRYRTKQSKCERYENGNGIMREKQSSEKKSEQKERKVKFNDKKSYNSYTWHTTYRTCLLPFPECLALSHVYVDVTTRDS